MAMLTATKAVITPEMDLLLKNLRQRAEQSKAEYGTYLRPRNGRHAKTDLYQELCDSVMYNMAWNMVWALIAHETVAPHPDYATRPEPAPTSSDEMPVVDFIEYCWSNPTYLDGLDKCSIEFRLIMLLLDVQGMIERELDQEAR